ncbi:MAG: glycosyltransferase family 4 protein [Tychonema bourrellyi B0820]|uniref:Glycosyltransferase family 1 protein n=1 Tax=Tychonema bourrellyi FEM_GT703 TaxID=2040638 RepID=A0A2G4EXF9_9CYAN|nr:glycosyltransferase family 4 protein [Tychonema bourrellyi]MDQ2099517.1 glycosyltransferase family 4 protein [Tychonema bourrellyi B0820]PHX54168.1 glycosyltransferase family 1 protein [Tychonema bourrellyi FEM_GT703]
MNHKKLKVLLIIEQCNPEWASVPLVGYNFFQKINNLVDATLVTHIRNKPALEKHPEYEKIFYLEECNLNKQYYKIVAKLTANGRVNWPLHNALSYPIYAEFNQQVYQKFQAKIVNGDYDIVHAITPMMPRYPCKVVNVCQQTPFILGPVNGGIPFPPGFQETAKQEFAQFNFLRAVGRALIPGYVETYKKADKILAGSTYTLNMLKDLFTIPDHRIDLFYENGISEEFLNQTNIPKKDASYINLLFVGRLVPYKCADIVIESIGKLDQAIQNKIRLKIVGDGQERNNLENRVKELHLDEIVSFAGWVNQQDTLDYYRKADIFCFPSIREFGGAVVMEAMACGLPCIVANNGGIGEYVNEETGFKIEPNSREYLTQELTSKIKLLVEDDQLRENMSAKAIEKAREFAWDKKAEKIVEIYQKMLDEKAIFAST